MNDEGRVLEENLPDVPHLQAPDRVALARDRPSRSSRPRCSSSTTASSTAGWRATSTSSCSTPSTRSAWGGSSRAACSASRSRSLRRAGVVVLSRADLVAEADRRAIRREAERRAGPLRWAEARHAPLDLVDADGPFLSARRAGRAAGSPRSAGSATRKGSAGPWSRWAAPWRASGPSPITTPIPPPTWPSWPRGRPPTGADLALTTQKDLVKLRAETLGAVPLRALRIGLEVLGGDSILETALRAAPASGEMTPAAPLRERIPRE